MPRRCMPRPNVPRAASDAMAALNLEPNIASPDDFYEALLDAHRGLTLGQSQALNARLILILANHVGDGAILHDAMRCARQALDDAPAPRPESRSVSSPTEEGDS